MLNRRSFCACASLSLFSGLSTAAHAQATECAVFTTARQKEVSPDEAIERLVAGNARFVSGKTVNCNLMQQVKETAKSQAPFATIVGCIDSRVPPELVFDQRIGDVFVARIAGNFVNTDIIGSLEFATKIVGSRAIVVLGHSECGAIKGAVDDVRLGNLTAALSKIRPAVEATKADGDRTAKNASFVQAVAITNAKLAAGKILEESPLMKELVAQRQLRVVPAMHDVATGKVTFLA